MKKALVLILSLFLLAGCDSKKTTDTGGFYKLPEVKKGNLDLNEHKGLYVVSNDEDKFGFININGDLVFDYKYNTYNYNYIDGKPEDYVIASIVDPGDSLVMKEFGDIVYPNDENNDSTVYLLRSDGSETKIIDKQVYLTDSTSENYLVMEHFNYDEESEIYSTYNYIYSIPENKIIYEAIDAAVRYFDGEKMIISDLTDETGFSVWGAGLNDNKITEVYDEYINEIDEGIVVKKGNNLILLSKEDFSEKVTLTGDELIILDDGNMITNYTYSYESDMESYFIFYDSAGNELNRIIYFGGYGLGYRGYTVDEKFNRFILNIDGKNTMYDSKGNELLTLEGEYVDLMSDIDGNRIYVLTRTADEKEYHIEFYDTYENKLNEMIANKTREYFIVNVVSEDLPYITVTDYGGNLDGSYSNDVTLFEFSSDSIESNPIIDAMYISANENNKDEIHITSNSGTSGIYSLSKEEYIIKPLYMGLNEVDEGFYQVSAAYFEGYMDVNGEYRYVKPTSQLVDPSV